MLGYGIAISIFMILCFISSDAAVTIFGIPLRDAPGVKELLLVLSTSVALIMFMLQQSQQLRVTILEKLAELRTNSEFASFAKLASKTPFDLNVYVTKQYDKWIFPTLPARLITGLVVLLLCMVFGGFLIFNWVLWLDVYFKILRVPTLGIWSYAALIYGAATSLCVLLWFIRVTIPFPYRDRQKLKELKRLSETDQEAYEVLRNELYGDK